ncbi:MAG: hypothetical protein CML06_14250, partial [Pseudomonadales bacterium]|nr:hypothetical protein [Pseudomonadales bacterium]
MFKDQELTAAVREDESKSLVIISSGVERMEHLCSGLLPGASVFIVDSIDGFAHQLDCLVSAKERFVSVHLITHGRAGGLQLGDQWFDNLLLSTRPEIACALQSVAAPDASLVLYGCEVAKGNQGQQFCEALERVTGLSVRAASDKVGAPALGGQWELDYGPQPWSGWAITESCRGSYSGVFASVVTVTDVRVTESDGSFSPTMEFTVNLSEASLDDITIDYQTLSGTAIEGSDYIGATGTLTIAAGETSGIISVTTYGYSEEEFDESFVLELTNPNGAEFADGLVSLRASGTILDNDNGGEKRALFVDDVQIVEGDAGQREAVFYVRLSQAPTEELTLDFTTTDGSAVAGEDYELTTGTLTFTPDGELVQEVRVAILGDLELEGTETFSLTVTPTDAIASGAVGASGTASILDDDAGDGTVPVISVTAATEVAETNSTYSSAMQFVVTLSEASATDTYIDYQTLSDTAKEGSDFIASSGTLLIPAGETSGVIAVTTYGYSEIEADESFTLQLSNPQGGVFAGDAVQLQAQGVLIDNDGSGNKLALLVSDAQLVEGDSGQSEAVFEVRLSQPSTEAITLTYSTRDATALAGSDYESAAGTVTFLPGETVKAVTVAVNGDAVVEGSEQFSLIVSPSDAIGNGVSDAEGIATILDDDAGSGALPVLSVAAAEVLENNSTYSPSMQFVVTLSEAATTNVTVDYQTVSGSALETDDYIQTRQNGQLVIAAGESTGVISITTYGYSEIEADENFFVELSNVQGAVFAGEAITLQAQGVMLDNDGTGEKRALLVSDAQLVEGDSGQREAVFDVRLSRPSETDITVEYTTVSGSAQSGEDFAPTTGTITFLAGQTIAAVHVPVYGDTALEASEQFSLVLSPPQGADFAAGEAGVEATATILDDDASDTQPVISIADIAIHEGNSTYGPNIEFVVTLSAPSTETVQVAYTTVDGSAQAGNDYIGASGTLSFAPGQTSAVVALTSYGYSVVEPDETFTLQLSSPQNAVLAGGVDTLSATGTIIDNDDTAPVDGLPILSVADIQVQEASGGSTAIFTLNLSSPSAIEVSGDFSVAAGTATAGDDFTPVAGTFSFAPGETSVTVEVAIAEDLIQEPTETIVLRLENLENGQFSNFADQLLAIGEILDQGNLAPQAQADQFGTDEDTAITGNVLVDNGSGADSDANGDPLTVTAVNGVAAYVGQTIALTSGALLTLNADGSFDYDPNGQFDGLIAGDISTDTFNYTLSDGNGGEDTATASINITGLANASALPLMTVSDATITETNSTYSPAMEFLVTLSAPSLSNITVNYQTISGTAIEGSDYIGATGTLTIAAGETSGIISVTTYGYSEEEFDESFVLELTNPNGAEFADGLVSLRASGTILDNDNGGEKRALFVDDVQIVEGDAGQREAVFYVRLSQAPTEELTLDFTTTDGSAVAGEDYELTTGTLTFTPDGELVQEVRVAILGDLELEGTETFSLTVTPTDAIASGAVGASGTASILDDDAGDGTVPVISVTAATEVAETNSTYSSAMQFVVTLSEASATDTYIDYQTLSDTAKEGSDFIASSGTLLIPAGETSGVIAVTTYGYSEIEADESFTLQLSNPQGGVFAGDAVQLQAQGVLIDNDGSGNKLALLVSDAQLVEGDSGQSEAVFEVRLSQPSTEAITLTYSTRDATALAGSDYESAAGTVTFLPGETVKAVTVAVNGDAVVEGSEQFSLIVSPSDAIGNGVSDAEGIATILDDDAGSGALPVLSVAAAEVLENNSTYSPSMQFVVTLSEAATTNVTVDYQTVSGSALETDDYIQTRQNGQLVIAAGESTGVISITTYGYSEIEADENFFVELSNVQGAVFAGEAITLQAQGVMLDNDGTGEKRALLVSDAQLVEGDSGQREAVFDVRLSRPSETDITVEYTTVSGSAQSGEDFAPTTGTITFLAGQTIAAVHVPVYGDTALEASEQFSLVLSPPQGADFAAGEAGVEATATILDDDASDTQPVISIADIAIHEGNSTYGPNIEFVVTLSAPSTETVQVAYTTVDGSAQAGNDYIGASGTLSFAPGQTSAVVALTSYGYSVVEPDETFTLQLSSPQNAVLAGGVDTLSATGTIIDNDDTAPVDGLPILSVADIQVQEASGGSTAIFTLNLSSPSAIEVSGDFSVAAGTATAGDDFTPVAGTFSFAPGETSVTVEVAIAEDLIQEPTETIVLRLENLENGQFSNFADQLLAIGEILDQEVAGLSLDVGIDANQSEGTTFSRLISFSDGEDSNGDGWTYEVDWGDGSAVETGATT